jgi:hypothetical protein
MDNNRRQNTAKNKVKQFRISGYLKIGTWNVRGICHRENELENKLKKMKVDIAAITQTKRWLKVQKNYMSM